MIRSYFITGLRTLLRNKGFSSLNILGLATGIAFSCMLYVYVNNELSYDQFHTKSDRIYRIVTIDERDPQNVRRYGVTVPPLAAELACDRRKLQADSTSGMRWWCFNL